MEINLKRLEIISSALQLAKLAIGLQSEKGLNEALAAWRDSYGTVPFNEVSELKADIDSRIKIIKDAQTI